MDGAGGGRRRRGEQERGSREEGGAGAWRLVRQGRGRGGAREGETPWRRRGRGPADAGTMRGVLERRVRALRGGRGGGEGIGRCGEEKGEEKGEAAALLSLSLSLSLCDGATREEGIERCVGTRRRRWIEGEMREDRGILSLATCVCGGGAGRERGDGPRERWIERGGRARVRGAAAGPWA